CRGGREGAAGNEEGPQGGRDAAGNDGVGGAGGQRDCSERAAPPGGARTAHRVEAATVERVMALWHPIPGETPIDDISGLKIKGITLRRQLNDAEARNIFKVLIKYFGGALSLKTAPFSFSWALQLHQEMFGDVWQWAGVLRTVDLNLGVPWQHVETRLYDLLESVK